MSMPKVGVCMRAWFETQFDEPGPSVEHSRESLRHMQMRTRHSAEVASADDLIGTRTWFDGRAENSTFGGI